MALREILTYQGASAGIFIPEVSCPVSSLSNLNEEDNESTMKIEREIDLNLQVTPEESEPSLKRPKLEEASFPMSGSIDGDLDVCMKVEDGGLLLNTLENGEIDVNPVKMESQSGIEIASHSINIVTEVKEHSEGKESSEKMNISKSLPQNTELMNFVKDARTSWMRNCEFLQDCAIRFLCVLSLDRYDLLYRYI